MIASLTCKQMNGASRITRHISRTISCYIASLKAVLAFGTVILAFLGIVTSSYADVLASFALSVQPGLVAVAVVGLALFGLYTVAFATYRVHQDRSEKLMATARWLFPLVFTAMVTGLIAAAVPYITGLQALATASAMLIVSFLVACTVLFPPAHTATRR